MGCLCKQAWVSVWERGHFNGECVAGQGDGKKWNLPYGWKRKTKGETEGRRGGRRKGRNSAAHVNSLNAPCWPRGCWQHSFVDSFPHSDLFPVFCSQSLFQLPLWCSISDPPRSVSLSCGMTLWIPTVAYHVVRSAASCQRVSRRKMLP